MPGQKGGRRPGAGRPPKELHERKRWLQQQAVLEWTTVDDAKMFWQTQLSFAKAGDHNAAKLVAGYIFGQPTQVVEVSGPDGAPIQVSHRPDLSGLSVEELQILERILSKSPDA